MAYNVDLNELVTPVAETSNLLWGFISYKKAFLGFRDIWVYNVKEFDEPKGIVNGFSDAFVTVYARRLDVLSISWYKFHDILSDCSVRLYTVFIQKTSFIIGYDDSANFLVNNSCSLSPPFVVPRGSNLGSKLAQS